jgi:hypothetical protein
MNEPPFAKQFDSLTKHCDLLRVELASATQHKSASIRQTIDRIEDEIIFLKEVLTLVSITF